MWKVAPPLYCIINKLNVKTQNIDLLSNSFENTNTRLVIQYEKAGCQAVSWKQAKLSYPMRERSKFCDDIGDIRRIKNNSSVVFMVLRVGKFMMGILVCLHYDRNHLSTPPSSLEIKAENRLSVTCLHESF